VNEWQAKVDQKLEELEAWLTKQTSWFFADKITCRWLDVTVGGSSSGVDHGGLVGLADNDHNQYLLTDASNDPVTGHLTITPAADSTTVFQVNQADTTNVFTVDTTDRKIVVASGTTGQSTIGAGLIVNNDSGSGAINDFRVNSDTLTAILVDASADTMVIGVEITITGFASDEVGLTIKGAASQSANLQEWQTSTPATIAYITPTGGLHISDWARHTSANYRRYYHLDITGFDPGASGATWTDSNANTVGGWQLDNAGEKLHAQVDIHADWDGASDLTMEVYFEINAASAEDNTVDIKAEFYYKGLAETATKSQTVEVATNVGDGGAKAQFTMFKAIFTIDWDATDNVIETGDIVHVHLNLETDTSEVDDIIVNKINYYYNTAHLGIESGDT